MIASLLRKLNLRRRNVVDVCHKDAIDRLSLQLVSARLRVNQLSAERNAWINKYWDLRTKVHTTRDPITGRYKRKEG